MNPYRHYRGLKNFCLQRTSKHAPFMKKIRFTLYRLLISEIRFRKMNFLLGSLSLCLALSVLLISLFFIRQENRNAAQRAQKFRLHKEAAMNKMVKDYKRIAEELNYTIRILPPGQKAVDFYDKGFSSQTMPSDLTDKISALVPRKIRFCVPVLRMKVFHPLFKQQILICGVGKPYSTVSTEHIPRALVQLNPGEAALGYELHRQLNDIQKKTFTYNKRSFNVTNTIKQQGSVDDITLWLSLEDAQSLFEKPHEISELWIWGNLDPHFSNTHLKDRLSEQLPKHEIIEVSRRALLQIRAQETAQKAALDAMKQEQHSQLKIMKKRRAMVVGVSLIIIIMTLIWCVMLITTNVTQRIHEIAMLHAIGFSKGVLAMQLLLRIVLMSFTAVPGSSIILFLYLFQSGVSASIAELTVALLGAGAGVPIVTAILGIAPILHTLQFNPSAALADELGGI